VVKNQIVAGSVVSEGLGVRATGKKYGVFAAWVSTFVSRYRKEGPSGYEPRSKRPHANAKATSPVIEHRIVELRKELVDLGTDETVRYYNGVRPHRGIDRKTPHVVYNARAKAQPNTLIHLPHWRIRTDTVYVRGHVCLRHLGRQRHLNVGWRFRGQQIRFYVLDDVVTFVTKDGELIGATKSTPIATTSRKGQALDSPDRFRCSRCRDRFHRAVPTGFEPVSPP
jgi:hypothetical protein